MTPRNARRPRPAVPSIRPGAWLRRLRSWRSSRRARRRIRELEALAAEATDSFRSHHYLRAAQLAAEIGDRGKALELYGLAIDGHIEAGRGKAAEALCRKVVTLYPDVVRTRRTLALLAVGRGDAEEATALVHQYAERASLAGDGQLLRRSLTLIALISRSPMVRAQAVAELRATGDEEGAVHLLDGDTPQHDAFDTSIGRWSQATVAALLGAQRLREIPV